MTTDVTDVIAQAIATAQQVNGDVKAASTAAAEAFAAGLIAYEESKKNALGDVKHAAFCASDGDAMTCHCQTATSSA